MINTVLKEYGLSWAFHRVLYSIKLKTLRAFPFTEVLYEKKVQPVKHLDIIEIDSVEIARQISELSIEQQQSLITEADDICRGKIKGFSSIELDYGNPIDWMTNPLTGKKCSSTKKWYMIPDFDAERGDLKVTWEISRFSHLITLTRAFLLTKDEKYYHAFSDQIAHWNEINMYSFGPNFKCGQECSFRMINTILAYQAFKSVGITTSSDERVVKEIVLKCYKKILANFSYAYRCIRNNHTISELVGMIIGAWCTSDEKQKKYAISKINEVINEQFLNDGGYIQYSFTYQRLALQDIECLLAFERKVGTILDEEAKKKIGNSAKLIYQCQLENGDVPNYGANDGALVIPASSCGYRDFRPIVNSIYALIYGQQLYCKGPWQEELLWFIGKKCINDIPYLEMKRQSCEFPDIGLYTLRQGDMFVFIVLSYYHTRPGHMDQLHIDFWKGNTNIFCDQGTYSYATELGSQLSKTESHNTVQVDEYQQMSHWGHFLTYNWTIVQKKSWTKNSFVGQYKTYAGYIHHREILLSDTSLKIKDKIINAPKSNAQMFWYTPLSVLGKSSQKLQIMSDKVLCDVTSDTKCYVQTAVTSKYYLRLDDINCIRCAMNKNDKNELVNQFLVETR